MAGHGGAWLGAAPQGGAWRGNAQQCKGRGRGTALFISIKGA